MKNIFAIIAALFLVASVNAQTRNVVVNTNSVIISPTNFWSADAANARSGLGLGTAATNPSTAFQPSSSVLTNLANNNGATLTNIPVWGVIGALATNGNGSALTNITASNIAGTVALASNVSGVIAITNGGTGATNEATARTNLGLGSAATNSESAFQPSSSALTNLANNNGINLTNISVSGVVGALATNGNASALTNFPTLNQNTTGTASNVTGVVAITNGGTGASNAATARTNLGLGWSALTNTTSSGFQTALFGANTNPVLVNTNGSVVSPTNFWQSAPISTTVQSFTNVTGTSTNVATNSRNLYLYSLSPSVSGITNTITLPTNGSTFNGDVATIIHSGNTNSTTAVRQLGSSTNIIILNQLDEAVRLIYKENAWTLADNISYIEPIYFSGTNAIDNAAASRTNLGIGATWLTNTNVTNFRTAIELGVTNNVTFSNIIASGTLTSTGVVTAVTNLNVGGAIAVTNAALTRTNLGLPLPALTNTSNTNFQAAIFTTNSIPTNSANVNAINFNTAVAWMGITVVTNGVTNTFRIPLFQ
jgi:hypothetical protein